MSNTESNILNQKLPIKIKGAESDIVEPICYRNAEFRVPWTYKYHGKPIALITTDFKKLHYNYMVVDKDGFLIVDEFTPTTLKPSINCFNAKIYDLPEENFIANKYRNLGMDSSFVREHLAPSSCKRMNYQKLVDTLKYIYVDGKFLRKISCTISKQLDYINFELSLQCCYKNEAVEFLKKNKKRVDLFVVKYVNSALKYKNENLNLNFYKCEKIVVTHDALVLYQFGIKNSDIL